MIQEAKTNWIEIETISSPFLNSNPSSPKLHIKRKTKRLEFNFDEIWLELPSSSIAVSKTLTHPLSIAQPIPL